MCGLVRITMLLVVLSLTGWAQNPFEQQAAVDYTGVFVSETFKLRLHGDADHVVGELRWTEGDKKYEVSAKVNESMLRGTFSDASGSFSFSLKQSGAEYLFVAGDQNATLKKLPPLDLSGEWGNSDASLTVKLGDVEGNQIQGIVFFKGQKYVLSGTASPIGVMGAFSSNGQTFPLKLLQSFEDNRLQFTTGSYSTILTSKRELDRQKAEAELEQRRQKMERFLPGLPELHVAAARGDIARLRELLAAGGDVEAKHMNGIQPIHYAAWFGRLDALRFLVAEGAKVSTAEGALQNQPLHFAAQIGAVPTMEYLVSQGALVKAKNKIGSQPIHYAARENSIEAIKYLVSQGAKVDAKREDSGQPIHYAASKGHLEALECLASLGADVNAKDRYGAQPIHVSARNLIAVKWLVSKGADLSARDNNGAQPIHYAAWYGGVEVIKWLVSQGAKVDAKREDGNQPIHMAALQARADAIRCLVSLGADANAKGKDDKTPLDHAEKLNKPEVAALLRELGAKSGEE